MPATALTSAIHSYAARAWARLGLSVPAEIRDELLQLQYNRVGVLVPLLYIAIGLVASVASFFTQGGFSWLHHAILPGFFLTLGLVRGTIWYRRRHSAVDSKIMQRRLRTTVVLGLVMGMVASMWTLDAYYNTSEMRRIVVPIFLLISSWMGAICIASMPRAAIAVTVVTQAAPTIIMLAAADSSIKAMALCFVIVSAMLIGLILSNFSETVSSLMLRRELKHLSETDPLTGLANRRALENCFAEAQANARKGQYAALFTIDLDGFKQANDRYGHIGGDAVLREVAQRLVRLFPAAHSIARLGGDEFAILMFHDPDLKGDVLSEQMRADTLRSSLNLPYHHDGRIISISASIGAVSCPLSDQTLEHMMEQADRQLYDEKLGYRRQL